MIESNQTNIDSRHMIIDQVQSDAASTELSINSKHRTYATCHMLITNYLFMTYCATSFEVLKLRQRYRSFC